MKIYLKLIIKYFVGFIKLRTIEGIQAFPVLKSKKLQTLWKANFIKTRAEFHSSVVSFFEGKNIDYFEFGVYQGETIKYFSENFKNTSSIFVGFDSFTGIPETYGHPSIPTGHFSVNGVLPVIDDTRVKFIKGYFNQNKNEIKQELSKSTNTKLVHFDADIYSSTLYVLFQLDDHTPYYAMFDEFGGDEARALYAYLIATDKEIEIISTTFDDKFNIVPRETFMKIY
jgi:hypothetical protein